MKRSRLEERNGILMWKWTLEYLDRTWNHVETKGHQQQQHRRRFQRYLHLHLRHNPTVMNPRCVDKECTQKHSGSELSGLKSAELLDARHVRLQVQESHTLVNAKRIKIPGTKVDEKQRRRRRNAELLRIQTHDHWTGVQVRRTQSRRGRKRPPWQTLKTWQTRWMWTTFKGHPQPLFRWEPDADENVSKRTN